MGVGAAAGETPSLTGEVVGETHRGLECAQAHPLGNKHQRGPIRLWVAQRVTEIRQRVQQAPLLPHSPSPTYSVTAQQPALPHPGEHLRLRPFNRRAKTKKVAQMTEHFKAPEIIQLSSKQIANLSDAQFRTLLTRKLQNWLNLVANYMKNEGYAKRDKGKCTGN